LRLYPAATRAALHASIAGGQPYVTLVLLREEAREAVREAARAGGWTREERVREDLEAEQPEQPSQGAPQGVDHMRAMFNEAGLGELLTGTTADPKSAGKREVAFPLLTDTKQLHTIGVAAEIAVLAVSGRLIERIGAPRLFALSLATAVVRWSLLARVTSATAILCLQPLHGITFALLHLACMRLIGRIAPAGLEGTAQALYGSGIGAVSAAVMMSSGALYAELRGAAFWIMSMVCTIALPLILRLARLSPLH